MAHGLEVHDVSTMDDGELREFVWKHLCNYEALDAQRIYVQVQDGTVRLIGRVGEDSERSVAEHVLTDVLGLENVDNQLIVDPVVRMDIQEGRDEDLDLEDEEIFVDLLESNGLDSSEARDDDDEFWVGGKNGAAMDDEDDIVLPDEPRAI